jgi:NNP family nitrate/nitrite transporter-like MFS transporter
MALATGVILLASLRHSLALFLVAFIAVFVLSGMGNGSTYKMIPAVFEQRALARIDAGGDRATALSEARRHSGALLGIVGAVGAFGGVLINLAFRESYATDASANPAFLGFIAFYALGAVTTYAGYVRRPEPVTARVVALGEGSA